LDRDAAHLELLGGVVQLRPQDAMFEAMLSGWAAQQMACGLREKTIEAPACARAATTPPANTNPAGPARQRRDPHHLGGGRMVSRPCQHLRRRPVPPHAPPVGNNGGGKAAIAIARTLIVIIWHVLHDEVTYRDLGTDYYTRYDNAEAKKRRLIRELQALGGDVTIQLAARPQHLLSPTAEIPAGVRCRVRGWGPVSCQRGHLPWTTAPPGNLSTRSWSGRIQSGRAACGYSAADRGIPLTSGRCRCRCRCRTQLGWALLHSGAIPLEDSSMRYPENSTADTVRTTRR
jgi:hypothetical protein